MRLLRPRDRQQIKLSGVMSALSYVLDIVEGQPQGHAIRSCLIGMRIARHLDLSHDDQRSLFYALLMKDLGCSSNAAKMCFLFAADDQATKGSIKTVNWRNMFEQAAFGIKHVAPGKPWLVRLMRLFGLMVAGQRAGKELIQIRCERGAQIARQFGLSEDTAQAIHCLDEHFDGGGHPDGLIGDQIPLLARIMGLSQTAEVFLTEHGRDAMRTMARQRRGTWFDPELVDILLSIDDLDRFWLDLDEDPRGSLAYYEPADREIYVDDARLDDIADGFAQVIDAKSPWTCRHSRGVADISVGIAEMMGLSRETRRDIRRAALLHDVGKLGVSNLILDKPGKLDDVEIAAMRKHTTYTFNILQKLDGFRELADLAASHHERLDGKGYHRGLGAEDLSVESRILCVADMYEALAAKRPYRQDMSNEQVMDIITKHTGPGLCPNVVDGLKAFLHRGTFQPYQLAA